MSFETKAILQGNKRDERSYGTPGGQGGERPLGGINGGLLLLRPSRHEFQEMMRHLLPHGFLEKQKRDSWIAKKIQLPSTPGGIAGAGSTRRLRVLEDGEQSLGGCGELALQCRPEASRYDLGKHRLSSPGDWQWQQRIGGAGDSGRAASGDINEAAPQRCTRQDRLDTSMESPKPGQGKAAKSNRAGPSATRVCCTMAA